MFKEYKKPFKHTLAFFSMIQENYEKLVSRISAHSGLTQEEIERRVEAKRAKLSGLISKEGAAQVIAAELGINFDNQKVKIVELFKGMRKASINAKILQIFPVRKYIRSGTENKVANLLVADETATVRTVLWDTNHISLIEDGKIQPGLVVEIKNASVRGTTNIELHLTNLSSIEVIAKEIENVSKEEILQDFKLNELRENTRGRVRATIIQVFEPKFFYVCPECKSKAVQENEGYICKNHGNVVPEKKVLITIVLDDGTEVIRAVLFNEPTLKLLSVNDLSEIDQTEFFTTKKQEIIGKELFLEGRVRKNQMFNSLEFVVSDFKEADPDEILKQFEKQNIKI